MLKHAIAILARMWTVVWCAALVAGLRVPPTAAAGEAPAVPSLPAPVVPEGLGVNIHFTDPKPGEMKMLAEAGFGIVRMDFAWEGTERKKGEYNFTPYERLLAALEPHKIRALFILDYSNRLYDQGLSPHSDEGREAFAKWAAAAAAHFKGRGILWEMYNEPNIGFWKPRPNADDYVKLAVAVGKAIRAAAPGELYIGPATSELDLRFLETCFKGGLLEHWDAVTVHPYRQTGPETAAEEYRRLRSLIRQYAPKGKDVPILSGEWGYSAAWSHYDETKQGKCLPRQWLVNLASSVNLSIWYDWHDDGKNPKEPEHHFGTTLFPYFKDREPVYDTKPAYLAAKTLTTTLKGLSFSKRLASGGEQDWVLLFAKGGEARLAVWSVAEKPQPLKIPASPGKFRALNHLGQDAGTLEATADGLTVTPTDAPLYLIPEQPNDLLAVAAAWERAALEYWLPGAPEKSAITLRLKNPLAREIRVVPNAMSKGGTLAPGAEITWEIPVKLTRGDEPVAVRFECDIEGMGKLSQQALACVQAPLRLAVMPLKGDGLTLKVENPFGAAFRGAVALSDVAGLQVQEPRKPVELKDGEREKAVTFPCAAGEVTAYRVGATLCDELGTAVLTLPVTRYAVLGGFPRGDQAPAYRVVPDGDAKVASEQTLTAAAPPEPPPLPDCGVLKVAYRFEAGWKFCRVVPTKDEAKALEGQPKALSVWVYGDGQNLSPRLRFVDATGQCFQPGAPNVDFKGWRPVVFALDGRDAGHWGGANDGKVHYPVKLDTLFLLDNGSKQKVEGTIYLQAPVLSW